jgi:hypothetical protein
MRFRAWFSLQISKQSDLEVGICLGKLFARRLAAIISLTSALKPFISPLGALQDAASGTV